MRGQWRHLQSGELDHELIWLAVSGLAAAGMSVWLALQLPLPQCHFRALFGVPCLTCGSTRAASALLHGEIGHAWLVSPLATVAFCGMAGFDLYAIAILSSGARRVRFNFANKNERRAAAAVLAVAAFLNWIYLLRRG